MAEIADANLPTFPFRVNWKAGVAERLEWKTDVLGDFLGNEQRRALRLTPRREFEVTLTLWDADRAFWDLWLHRMAGVEFLFPVWHDSVRASQDAPQGQKTIWADTRGLEFQIGSYGLLRGLTAQSFERFQIAEVYDDRIVTVANLVLAWPKGTRVEPVLRGRLTDQTNVKPVSTRASETQAVIQCVREQPYGEGVDSWDQYMGMPVLAITPNRSEDLSSSFDWAFSESDSLSGRRFRKSDTGRASVHQKHTWLLKGRTAKVLFRQLCYRLRGSAKAFWLPTFNDDLALSRNAGVAATSIYVKAMGFAYTGGPTSGREYVCVQKRDGTRLYRRITGTAASGSVTEERLVLDAPLPGGLTMGEVSRISWMDTARFENDRIEMSHVNAADGATTVAGVFQTFRHGRSAPAILSAPIPQAAKVFTSCGTDAPEVDVCAPVFQGVYMSVRFSAPDPCNQCWDGNRDLYLENVQPNGPGGKSFQSFGFYGGGCVPFVNDVYENIVPGNPQLQGQLLHRFSQNNFNDWTWDFYFPCTFVQLHIFFSARYCGSVGKDEGTTACTVTYAGFPPTTYGPKPSGGLYEIYFP